MDPIIAATWSEDGAVHDVCKALAPRFREPNAVVRRLHMCQIRARVHVTLHRLSSRHL